MRVTPQVPYPAPISGRSYGLTFSVDHHLRYQTCFAVTGEIDITTADSLANAATDALRPWTRLLILDLAGVSFCGAAGINALITIHRTAVAAGASLALANASPRVQRLLDLVDMNAMFAGLPKPQPASGPRSAQGTITPTPNGHRRSGHDVPPQTSNNGHYLTPDNGRGRALADLPSRRLPSP